MADGLSCGSSVSDQASSFLNINGELEIVGALADWEVAWKSSLLKEGVAMCDALERSSAWLASSHCVSHRPATKSGWDTMACRIGRLVDRPSIRVS